MAFDPEEFQKRRQQRQAQREQRQAQQKRMLLRLGIAGIVVIACTVLILTISMGGRDNTQPTQTTPPIPSKQTLAAEESTTVPTDPPITVIHLAAAGDLNVTQAVVDSATGDYDYTQTLMDVVPVLAQADITTLNLEGSFFGTPYGADRSAPPSLAQALSAAGVDLVQLANSYSIYKGMDGLSSTVDTIRSAGMEPVGAYANAKEAKQSKGYTMRTVKGIKIAFVAFTKGMHGMALPAGSERCVNLLYTDYASDYQTIDTEGITSILTDVKREKPDLTVALLHWGSEYNNTISQSQQDICKLLQEQGVDAIIGTHSHYVQQMDYDPETGAFVAYSLGDFLGDAPRAGSEYSVILDLEITKDNKTGDTKITGFDYTPIFNVVAEGKPHRVVRINQAITAYDGGYIDRVSQTTYEAMKYALERITARITGE